jgi:hypothetical protein
LTVYFKGFLDVLVGTSLTNSRYCDFNAQFRLSFWTPLMFPGCLVGLCIYVLPCYCQNYSIVDLVSKLPCIHQCVLCSLKFFSMQYKLAVLSRYYPVLFAALHDGQPLCIRIPWLLFLFLCCSSAMSFHGIGQWIISLLRWCFHCAYLH